MALELGCTVAQLRRTLTEREFGFWYAYVDRKGGLPARRLEIYVAQLALIVTRAITGNVNLTIDDFLLSETKPKRSTAGESASVIGAFAGVRVHKLGKKRRT